MFNFLLSCNRFKFPIKKNVCIDRFTFLYLQCVGDDIEDLEYTPKPEFEGFFKVTNVKNEVLTSIETPASPPYTHKTHPSPPDMIF